MLVGTLRLRVRLDRCFVDGIPCIESVSARVRQLSRNNAILETLAKQANCGTVSDNEFFTQYTLRFLSSQ